MTRTWPSRLRASLLLTSARSPRSSPSTATTRHVNNPCRNLCNHFPVTFATAAMFSQITFILVSTFLYCCSFSTTDERLKLSTLFVQGERGPRDRDAGSNGGSSTGCRRSERNRRGFEDLLYWIPVLIRPTSRSRTLAATLLASVENFSLWEMASASPPCPLSSLV